MTTLEVILTENVGDMANSTSKIHAFWRTETAFSVTVKSGIDPGIHGCDFPLLLASAFLPLSVVYPRVPR